MPMIPLSSALAMVLGYFLLHELTQSRTRNWFAVAFLTVLIVQLAIVSVRFGYGVSTFNTVFPLTAALVAPLAFLSFQNPAVLNGMRKGYLLLHLLPVVVAIVLSLLAPRYLDLAQGIFTLLYAGALLVLGLRETDTFPWVDFNRREYVRQAMWLVLMLLLISAATDLIIAVDSWRSRGANIPIIVGWTSTAIAVVFTPCIIWGKLRASRLETAAVKKSTVAEGATEIQLLSRLDQLIETTQLHLDPDLNLNRIARKLGVPARQVSAAINRQRAVSVSQFINNLRIEEACQLLKTTDLPVTRIMLQSGFVTKSNFNREFSRRLGQSPSVWRSNNAVMR